MADGSGGDAAGVPTAGGGAPHGAPAGGHVDPAYAQLQEQQYLQFQQQVHELQRPGLLGVRVVGGGRNERQQQRLKRQEYMAYLQAQEANAQRAGRAAADGDGTVDETAEGSGGHAAAADERRRGVRFAPVEGDDHEETQIEAPPALWRRRPDLEGGSHEGGRDASSGSDDGARPQCPSRLSLFRDSPASLP